MVLASQFKSLLQPLIIMMSVPLGLAGVMVPLYVTKHHAVGKQLHRHHHDGRNRRQQRGCYWWTANVTCCAAEVMTWLHGNGARGTDSAAAHRRMTTIATIVGWFRMALGIGEGSETNLPRWHGR